MNAHIDFLTREICPAEDKPARPRRAHHWFPTSAFRGGLCEGFGAPVVMLRRFEYPRATSIDTSILGAWKVVGDALKEATTLEGARIGKTTRKGRQGREAVSAD